MNQFRFHKAIEEAWGKVVAAISLLEPAIDECENDEGDARYDELHGIKNRLLVAKKKLNKHRAR